jgi:hypothetical protein
VRGAGLHLVNTRSHVSNKLVELVKRGHDTQPLVAQV